MNTGLDAAAVERLQADVDRDPAAYRLKLTLLAMAGDAALTAAQVVPVAGVFALGALYFNHPIWYWMSGIAIVFFVWLTRPTIDVKGRELTVDEAPLLFKQVAEIREKLAAPGRLRIFLDDSFNAGALESRGLWGIFGTQSVLYLGVPLLATLNREQVLAVIAHEFGHFSRRHGRLGHWLYRARIGWIEFSRGVTESDTAFDRAAAWYARQFVPNFSLRSFVWSRQCEYEADADAASIAGPQAMAEALTRLSAITNLMQTGLPAQRRRWRIESPQPPADYVDRFSQFVADCSEEAITAALVAAKSEPSNLKDTHPSLTQRLGALNQEAQWSNIYECAGESLLKDRWPRIKSEINSGWAKERAPGWRDEHLRLSLVCQPLLTAPAAVRQTWDPNTALAHGLAVGEIDKESGFAELRRLVDVYPNHQWSKFEFGCAMLREKDKAGIEWLERLAKESVTYRAPVFQQVHAFLDELGDQSDAMRWETWLKQALRDRAAAIDERFADPTKLALRKSSIGVGAREFLATLVKEDTCVSGAWLCEGDFWIKYAFEKEPAPAVFQLVGVCVDHALLTRSGQDEDTLVDRYRWQLQGLVEPDSTILIRSFYKTEPKPEMFGDAFRLV